MANANEADDKNVLDIIQQAMKGLGFQLNGTEQSKILDIVKQVVMQGATIKDTMGISKAYLETLYGLAYQLYNSGKYKDSGSVFRLLSVTDPEDPRFTMGLGASKQMIKDYDEAINAYLVCSLQDPSNPMPYFYLYECYHQSQRVRESFYALCETVKRIQRNPVYLPLLNKTLLLLEGLQKEIEEENYDLLKEKHLLKEDFDRKLAAENPLKAKPSTEKLAATPEPKKSSAKA